MSELKPCPFCGNEVIRDYVNDEYHHDISCSDCGETFRMSDEQWNTRPANLVVCPTEEEIYKMMHDLQNENGLVSPKMLVKELFALLRGEK